MFRLAAPIIVANLSVPLVGLVDTAVMGRLPDPVFLGASALGAVVFSSIFWAFGFLRMGTTGLVAQSRGAADGAALRALLLQNLMLVLVLGFSLIAARPWVEMGARWFLPASEAMHEQLAIYIEVRIWSAPAVLLNYVLIGVFVGLQRTGLALIAQLVLNLVNIVLSLWFVLGLDQGIAGVARASVIGEYAACALGLVLLGRALRAWPVPRWPMTAWRDWGAYRRVMAMNIDLFIRTLCLLFGFAWFARQGVALGETTLAANAVLLQLVHVLAFGLDGFAHAAEALVGEAVGARDRQAFRRAVRASTQWAAGTAAGFMLVYAVTAADLVNWLTIHESVRLEARRHLPWVVAMPMIAVWSYQLDGIFVGMLRTAQMRNAMLLATAGFVLATLVLLPWLGNHGLWLALAMYFGLRAVGLGWYLSRYPPLSSSQDAASR